MQRLTVFFTIFICFLCLGNSVKSELLLQPAMDDLQETIKQNIISETNLKIQEEAAAAMAGVSEEVPVVPVDSMDHLDTDETTETTETTETDETKGVKKKPQKRWKTALFGTLGSFATGNFMVDPASCLPKIKLPSGRVSLDLNDAFGGSTVLRCSEPGNLKIKQEYFYNFGNFDATWEAGKIGKKDWGGKSFSKHSEWSGGDKYEKELTHIGTKASERREARTAMAVKDIASNDRQKKKADAIIKNISWVGETGLIMENLEKKLQKCFEGMGDINGMGGNENSLLGESVTHTICLEATKTKYLGTLTEGIWNITDMYTHKELETMPVLMDANLNVIPENVYYAELYRQKPDVFDRYPDLFIEAPQILAENPHLLDNKPEAKKRIASILRHYPEKQIEIASAWVDKPELYTLYAELVPPEKIENRFAEKVEQIFAFLTR